MSRDDWTVPPDWFGAKRFFKLALETRALNAAMVTALRPFPVSRTISRLPVRASEVAGRVRDVRFVLLTPTRCSIAKELFWGRGERVRRDEQLTLELFMDLARASDLVLDIGANTGIFALVGALANERAEVHAFEIVPPVFELLVRNVVRNDVAHRVTCHLAGLGEDGFVMRVPAFENVSSLPTSASILDRLAEGARIGFESLDSFVGARSCGQGRTLLKIDVEGGEPVLFAHAHRALGRLGPDIVCEVLPDTDPSAALPAALGPLGYRFYRVDHDGLREHAAIEPSAVFHDWLFTRASPDELRARTRVPIVT